MPCCMVSTPDRAYMGNMFDQGVEQVWNGDVFNAFRDKLASGEPPDICKSCALYAGIFCKRLWQRRQPQARPPAADGPALRRPIRCAADRPPERGSRRTERALTGIYQVPQPTNWCVIPTNCT